MFIIHKTDGRQFPHTRPQPASRLRRGDGGAQPHARARNLSITQPAVSNALRRLREVLGDELVRRAGAGVEPTPRALALLAHGARRAALASSTLAPGEFDAGTADTTFLLAMADATAAELIPAWCRSPERRRPAISLRVLPLTTRDPRRMLEHEEVDMAIGYFPAVIAEPRGARPVGRGRALRDPAAVPGASTCA